MTDGNMHYFAGGGFGQPWPECSISLKRPAAQRKGHFFFGNSESQPAIPIGACQQQRRILADVQAALQHWLLDGLPNNPCSPLHT